MPIWYLNGQWVDQPITLAIEDAGVFQAVIAVERLRTYGGKIFAFADHWKRLHQSAAAMGIDASTAIDALGQCLDQLIQRNEPSGDVSITVLVTPGPLGANSPTVMAYQTALDQAHIERLQRDGQKLVAVKIQLPPPESVPRSIKTRSRLHYHLAQQQAAAKDPGATAVLIDQDGTLTETASANVLLVLDGVIYSPPRDRVLPGVTLGIVRRLADQLQIPWREQPLPVAMLAQADEILLTGTGAGLWHAGGRRGAVGEQLFAAFSQLTTQKQ